MIGLEREMEVEEVPGFEEEEEGREVEELITLGGMEGEEGRLPRL